jgi:hypothetical protein
MCNPIAYALISAAGTAMQVSSANRAAQANQQAAVDQQTMQNNLRIQEQQDQKMVGREELTAQKREALAQQASMRAAQGESGVQGFSPFRNLANIYMQESFNNGSIISFTDTKVQQIARQSEMDARQTKNLINVEESKKTSPLGALVQMGTSAASAYAAGGGFATPSPLDTLKISTTGVGTTGELGMFSTPSWGR